MGERSERPFRRLHLHLDVVASWDGCFSSEHDNKYEGRHASIIQTLVTIIKLLLQWSTVFCLDIKIVECQTF